MNITVDLLISPLSWNGKPDLRPLVRASSNQLGANYHQQHGFASPSQQDFNRYNSHMDPLFHRFNILSPSNQIQKINQQALRQKLTSEMD